jgi:hypothetical protein
MAPETPIKGPPEADGTLPGLNQPGTDGPVIPPCRKLAGPLTLDARDPIEVCDQAREQGDEPLGLLVCEVAQDLVVASE